MRFAVPIMFLILAVFCLAADLPSAYTDKLHTASPKLPVARGELPLAYGFRGVTDTACQCDLTGVCNCCKCENCPCSGGSVKVQSAPVVSYPVVNPSPVYYSQPPTVTYQSGGCVGTPQPQHSLPRAPIYLNPGPTFSPPLYRSAPPVFQPIRRIIRSAPQT